ncbi:MAG: succinylglutamate desuccinylase/aspartoacylase family protein, partial [Paracoccaceae bacterium]
EEAGVDVLLYEAGEGLRFDEYAARAGVSGLLRVLHHLGMIGAKGVPRRRGRSLLCRNSSWYRAPVGGLMRTYRGTGDLVEPGTVLGAVSDPFGEVEHEVMAEETGIIVGRTNMPVVNEGDALFHVAAIEGQDNAGGALAEMSAAMEAAPLFDEDEII